MDDALPVTCQSQAKKAEGPRPRQRVRALEIGLARGRLLGCVLALLTGLGVPCAQAADAESRAFNAAAKAFQDGFPDRAEREFADFARKYTNSTRLADAILLQARAAFTQRKTPAALALLTTNQVQAGALADQYSFWLGQMRLESADYAGAAEEFARLLKDYPQSSRRLEASCGQAEAHFKLRDWAQVAELLRKEDGAFQQAARADGNPAVIARGQKLLAEVLVRQQDYAGAEAAARRITTNQVETAWTRQELLCRIQMAAGREEEALAESTNLLALAAASGRPALQAEGFILQGTILEQLRQYEGALAAYDLAQGDRMPEPERREAFVRGIELLLSRNDLSAAATRLDRFLTAHPEDANSDGALLMLGELRLREHLSSQAVATANSTNQPTEPTTNRLQQALLCFDQLIQKHSDSPHLGQAQLDRGWALLSDGKVLESQAAFKQAIERLPLSEQQAVARFKLADTQFLLNDFTNALAGYRRLIEDCGGLPRVRTSLFDRAWYQMARLCMKMGDLRGASDAVRSILAAFPASLYADHSLLLCGQELNQTNRPAEARGIFQEYIQRFTNSALLPQAQLGLAHSYELENNWAAAIRSYGHLLAQAPTNSLAPTAEFYRALDFDLLGRTSNALHLFTNFLARRPTSEYAPRAQDWIGDYYFRNEDFAEAERNYQRLYQNTNWAAGDLAFEAKLKAGRAAVMRQGYDDAVAYFTSLINDKQCPAYVVAESFFAYADTLIKRPASPDSTNALARFDTAIETFSKIPQLYANSPLVPRALGRIADCQFQLAAQDPRRYTNALDYYGRALASPLADAPTRSQAEVGLANVLVRQAQLKSPPDPDLLKSALDHYLNVVYGKNLTGEETLAPLWVKEAGFAAARILESQKRWPEAIRLYERLGQVLPSLRTTLDKRIAVDREQLSNKAEAAPSPP